ATWIVIGGAFRLRVDLNADVAADPVVGSAGPTQCPAIQTGCVRVAFSGKAKRLRVPCARPAAVDLDVTCRLLIDRSWCFEHGLHVGGSCCRCKCDERDCAEERLLQHSNEPPEFPTNQEGT